MVDILQLGTMENNFEAFAVLAVQMINQQNQQFEAMMMTAALFAANELMELEEGDEGLDFANMGDWWVSVTVNLNEYHLFGNPCFKLHFRMSREIFEELRNYVTTVKEHLIEKGRLKRERTPFDDIMLMVVWLLATPDSFRSVALRFGVNPGTLYYFYFYTIETLRELAPKFIWWPDAEERVVIKETWERATGFPGGIGSIDGTHVPITAPLADANQYQNRHHQYSINVQAAVDCNLLVRDLYVGEVGTMHDSRVFRRSPLYRNILTDPQGEYISDDEHLVGDGAYNQTDTMMIPFANNGHLNPAQLIYNKKLSQSRVRVENAFGAAKIKWRRLKALHARNPAVVVDHITASFVLHNFIVLKGESKFDEEELGRPVNANEILGDIVHDINNLNLNDDDKEDAELRHLAVAANARGFEKRIRLVMMLKR